MFGLQPYSKKRKRSDAGPLWAERGNLVLAKITQPLMVANANQKGALNMEYDYKVTGQIIGCIRVQRGMSQEVLSGLAGVARSHLAMIENGSKNANVETLWCIAAALDMRMSELMRMVEDEIARRTIRRNPETF